MDSGFIMVHPIAANRECTSAQEGHGTTYCRNEHGADAAIQLVALSKHFHSRIRHVMPLIFFCRPLYQRSCATCFSRSWQENAVCNFLKDLVHQHFCSYESWQQSLQHPAPFMDRSELNCHRHVRSWARPCLRWHLLEIPQDAVEGFQVSDSFRSSLRRVLQIDLCPCLVATKQRLTWCTLTPPDHFWAFNRGSMPFESGAKEASALNDATHLSGTWRWMANEEAHKRQREC